MAVIELNVSSSPKKVLIEIAETNSFRLLIFCRSRNSRPSSDLVYDQIYQNEVYLKLIHNVALYGAFITYVR